jgi:hypothetical protein
MLVWRSASRHNTELPAKHSIVTRVSQLRRMVDMGESLWLRWGCSGRGASRYAPCWRQACQIGRFINIVQHGPACNTPLELLQPMQGFMQGMAK